MKTNLICLQQEGFVEIRQKREIQPRKLDSKMDFQISRFSSQTSFDSPKDGRDSFHK